jgi:sulfatase maturation enzyme AslB (radical SAM superfamily)
MDNVVLSLDGRKEVHDKFRVNYEGKGSYDTILPKFQEFVKRRGDKIKKMDLVNDIKIAVDRKNSIDEICGNLCSTQREHERFREEAITAQKAGAVFYVVVENTEGIKSVHDVLKWSNPRLHRYNKVNYMHKLGKWQNVQNKGKRPPCDNLRLMKTMMTMAQKYNIHWILCSPYESAAKIVELLSGEKDEKST